MNEHPFVPTKLEEERKDTKEVFTVRVNQEERTWLEEIKEDLNTPSDSKALKIAAYIGKNVLQGTFSRPILRFLFKKDRVKLEDYKNY